MSDIMADKLADKAKKFILAYTVYGLCLGLFVCFFAPLSTKVAIDQM